MAQPVSFDKDILDVVIQVLLIVLPILITWFIRTYVRGAKSERDIAAIVRLSNVAIDYVENLDKRGDLTLPPDISKGAAKLSAAGEWLEAELKRAGIKISNDEARKWIAAEFQKRVGDVRMVGTIAQLAKDSVDTILRLDQSGIVSLPSEIERVAYLSGLAADWIVAELAKLGGSISREEALIWARAELANRMGAQISGLGTPVQSVQDRLDQLAKQAVNFVEELKIQGQIAVPGEEMEADLAVAWLLTESAKQGLAVNSAQIADALTKINRQMDV